jgi:hypothetical protein
MRVLQGLLLVLLAVVCVQTWMLTRPAPVASDSFKAPLPEDERPSVEEQFVQKLYSQSEHAAEMFSKAQVPYTIQTIEAVARTQPEWLAGFVERRALDEDLRGQLGQILAKYMMHVNDVHLAEYRGSHSPKDTALFIKIEHSRLWRTLIELFGSEDAAELQILMEEHIPHQGDAESQP